MRTTLLGCLLAVTVAGGTVHAQPVAGDHEIQGSFGFVQRQGSDRGDLNLGGAWGYYVHRMVQLGLEQSLIYAFLEDERDVWVGSTAPFVNFHFRGWGERQTIVPFIGAVAGAVYNEDDATGLVGPQAGIKFFATDHVFIAPRYRYEWFFDDLDSFGDDSDRGNHLVTVNIGFLFGGPDRDRYDDDRDRYRSSPGYGDPGREGGDDYRR